MKNVKKGVHSWPRRTPPLRRVAYRGHNNANAEGGLALTNTSNDSSNSNANVGSRLEIKESAYGKGDGFPGAVPRGRSRGNSGRKAGKPENQGFRARVW